MRGVIFKQKLVTAQVQSQNRVEVSFTGGVHLPACKVACDHVLLDEAIFLQVFWCPWASPGMVSVEESHILSACRIRFIIDASLTDWKEYWSHWKG